MADMATYPSRMPSCASLDRSSAAQLQPSGGRISAKASQAAQPRLLATASCLRGPVGSAAELQWGPPEEAARRGALIDAFRQTPSTRAGWRREVAASGTVGYRAEEIWDSWEEDGGEAGDWAPGGTDAGGATSPDDGTARGAWELGMGGSQSGGPWQAQAQAQAGALQEEALEALEWGRLCRAVASFASTPLGADCVAAMRPAASEEEGLALLQETEALLQLESRTGGTLDFGASNTATVRDALRVLGKGVTLTGPQAAATAGLLSAVQGIQRTVSRAIEEEQSGALLQAQGRSAQSSAERSSEASLLHVLERQVAGVPVRPDLVKGVWRSVDEEGQVKDSASGELRRAREQCQLAAARAREAVERAAKAWGNQGGGTAEVQECGGRFCIAANTQFGSAPPGLLLKVESGSVHLVEPTSAVPHNNRLSEAQGEVSKAELAVLTTLSELLRGNLPDLATALEALVRMDVIAARARYSSWIGASKPLLTSPEPDTREPSGEGAPEAAAADPGAASAPLLRLQGVRHPLLLLQHREALRRARVRMREKAKVAARVRTRPGAVASGMLETVQGELDQASKEVADLERGVPVAIDVVVSRGTRVVTITGPNTGGKTAAIKTVALAALMAKAGLYVLARATPVLPFFDAVYADIGDQQSLAQSLSTFSGHVQRIGRIMDACTHASLVLLDEVGTGTDPVEGASLATAALEWFAGSAPKEEGQGPGGALLTLATTHHGELKMLKYRDPVRFENACVEFDEERLAPTYRLLWGIPGRSNALNIAQRLGIPDPILDSARSEMGSQALHVNDLIIRMETAKGAADRDAEAAEQLQGDAARLLGLAGAARRRVEAGTTVARMEAAREVATAAAKAHAAVTRAARAALVEAQMAERQDARAAAAAAAAASAVAAVAAGGRNRELPGRPKQEGDVGAIGGDPGHVKDEAAFAFAELTLESKAPSKTRDTGSSSQGKALKVGQSVLVKQLGKTGQIVELKPKKGVAVVQCGIMQLNVPLSDLTTS